MQERKSELKSKIYDERVLKIGIAIHDKIEDPLQILVRLLRKRRLHSFSAILIKSDSGSFGEFMNRHKRRSDLLYTINSKAGLYVLLCQETQVDGGYYFVDRLTKAWKEEQTEHGVIASIVAVESTKYEVWDIVFALLDPFNDIIMGHKQENVSYGTLK